MALPNMLDSFTLVGKEHQGTVLGDFEDQLSAKTSAPAITLLASIRHHHPEMTVAVTTAINLNLIGFARAGYATCELDTTEDSIVRSRGFFLPSSHADPGKLGDGVTFARYKYTWQGLEFSLYVVALGYVLYQFVLFPPDSDETVLSNSKATDALLLAVGKAQHGPYKDAIYVFESYSWYASSVLYDEVQKTSWSDVILDPDMKENLTHTIEEFFDNESRYRDLGVPWKRGIIFYGPPGNGKTISLRALMHSISVNRKRVTLLYVRAIAKIYGLNAVFDGARRFSPCLLIIEDIDTQITEDMRSYFFNQVDGLENNNGILMIATTNHIDQLDEGLKRPSRFDRRVLFPRPSFNERVQYCEFWRKKLEKNQAKIDYPEELSPKIAEITGEFSFATMKEAFIATLLAIARRKDDGKDKDKVDIRREKHLDDLPLWVEMQIQVKLLRKEMSKTDKVQEVHTARMAVPGSYSEAGSHDAPSFALAHRPLPIRTQPPMQVPEAVPPLPPFVLASNIANTPWNPSNSFLNSLPLPPPVPSILETPKLQSDPMSYHGLPQEFPPLVPDPSSITLPAKTSIRDAFAAAPLAERGSVCSGPDYPEYTDFQPFEQFQDPWVNQ